MADACILEVKWKRQKDQLKHIQTFCCDKYENCEIYRMVMQAKYEEDWEK
jgi:hypothetical protein